MNEPLTEASLREHVSRWLEAEAEHAAPLKAAAQYALGRRSLRPGATNISTAFCSKCRTSSICSTWFRSRRCTVNGTDEFVLPEHHWRHREGFKLTDAGMDLTQALDQANYCIKCHNQGKDSCSTGLKEKTGEFKNSVFGVTLAGCPLDEKISEMNLVKQNGYSIGALAITTIDNPMAAGTGHRICNDCMKACVFQKQEPVDIPQVETRTLKDVLELPWGFEIYSLLTRWNPLNFVASRAARRHRDTKFWWWVSARPASRCRIILMNDGHTVAAVDGLKIEPLPEDISGVTPHGQRVQFRPIRDVNEIYESLDDRVMAGFGGVAEYGITVRWNKNFLKVIRLLLERRDEFRMFGGVRFGGTLTVDDAFELGFDHVALCAGAGRPTVIPMKNGLARGVRQASDFLMALQLTGAAKPSPSRICSCACRSWSSAAD